MADAEITTNDILAVEAWRIGVLRTNCLLLAKAAGVGANVVDFGVIGSFAAGCARVGGTRPSDIDLVLFVTGPVHLIREQVRSQVVEYQEHTREQLQSKRNVSFVVFDASGIQTNNPDFIFVSLATGEVYGRPTRKPRHVKLLSCEGRWRAVCRDAFTMMKEAGVAEYKVWPLFRDGLVVCVDRENTNLIRWTYATARSSLAEDRMPVPWPGYTNMAGVVQVGRQIITWRDVYIRQAVNAAQPGQPKTIMNALADLVRAMVAVELLAAFDAEPTPYEMRLEAERITRTSLMPEILAEIQRACCYDSADYLRVYVAPVFAHRKLAALFDANEVFHADAVQRAYTVLMHGRAGIIASLLALTNDPKMAVTCYTMAAGGAARRVWPAERGDARAWLTSAEFVSNVVWNTDERGWHTNIVVLPNSYAVARRVVEGQPDVAYEVVEIPRASYADWFINTATVFPVVVLSESDMPTVKSALLGWQVVRASGRQAGRPE